jgi:hypothetical protein
MSLIVMFSCNDKTKAKERRNAEAQHISQTISQSDVMQQVPSNLTVINAEDDIIEIDELFELNNQITDLQYIYLKTEEPIGYINKVVIHKNRIIIADYMITNKVFIFDIEGNLIKIISDKGGGPKEYRNLGCVETHNDEIIVADGQNLKRLYYTLDGKYIRHERCLPCIEFVAMDDKFILHLDYHQSFTYKTTPNLVVSTKDSAIRRALPYKKIQRETTSGSFKRNYKGDILFIPVVSDTIYQILTDSTYTAKYVVKHKKSVWQKYNEELQHDEILQLIRNEGYSQLYSVFYETEKNIGFQLVSLKRENEGLIINSYWYDKATERTYKNTVPTTINGPNEGHPNIIPSPVGVWGDYYIGEIRPEQIEAIMQFRKEKKGTKDSIYFKNEELNKIMQLDEDPNQVVVLYKLDFNR